MKKYFSIARGFTLMEVLVVIAIVSILTSVVLVSMSDARANARDKVRIADIAQLELALRLYVEQNGSTIDCARGLKIDGNTTVVSFPNVPSACTDGQAILDFLVDYMGAVPKDPKSNSKHYYYFDAEHTCGTYPSSAILFAVRLEKMAANDADANCPASGDNNDGKYYDNGKSNPHVKKIDFITKP